MTGIWRGYFYSGYGFYRQTYKYEVQINQLPNKSLEGVTYSYKTTVFYGKATLSGIYFPATKHILIRELKLVDLKITDKSEPCLMTCDLEYTKAGSMEILQGTFSSIKEKDKSDCGSGEVYLERVKESDFKKEDFLKKMPPVDKKIPEVNNSVTSKVSIDKLKQLQAALGVTQDGVIGPKSISVLKSKVPDFEGNPSAMDSTQINKLIAEIKKNTIVKNAIDPLPPPKVKKAPDVMLDSIQTTSKETPKDKPSPPKELVKKIIPPLPDVLKKRENNLVKTINTSAPEIKISLYDNGEVDGDTVTVYHNNEPIIFKKGLSENAITFTIKADAVNAIHEFVMVADNLGTIPPNTALMVINTGGIRYELFLSTDNSKNAKVIIEYTGN